ncbi:MAG: hypothetical protein ACPGUU_06410 [Flavobacteriaceae bacterium]
MSFNIFSQKKKIKIISIDSLKYYYSYQVYDFKLKDTLILISNKGDKEFNPIKLRKNKKYEIVTRLISMLKVSEEKHYQVKPGMIFFNNVKISKGDNLPRIILNFEVLE